jgi:hypothetical protein
MKYHDKDQRGASNLSYLRYEELNFFKRFKIKHEMYVLRIDERTQTEITSCLQVRNVVCECVYVVYLI